MSQSNQKIEWYLMDRDCDEGLDSYSLNDAEYQKPDPNALFGGKQHYYIYELLLAIALLYGVAIYTIWQRAEQRIVIFEDELTTLRGNFEHYQIELNALSDNNELPLTNTSGNDIIYSFETENIYIETNEFAAPSVRPIVKSIDAKYRQIRQQYGLESTLPIDKLHIVITSEIDTEQHRKAPLLRLARLTKPEMETTSDIESLFATISAEITQRIWSELIDKRSIKPQWSTLTYALKNTIHRQVIEQELRISMEYLQRRHLAQTRTLQFVHGYFVHPSTEQEDFWQGFPLAEQVADPLMEYILETYGYHDVPLLLDAFEKHASWDTLAPDMFGITSTEFEMKWHEFLKEKYPLPSK